MTKKTTNDIIELKDSDLELKKNESYARQLLQGKQPTELNTYDFTRWNNKKTLIKALSKSFNIGDACAAAGISRDAFHKYRKEDPVFALIISELQEAQVDFVESKLTDRIMAEDTTAIIFYLKTKGKDRGYAQPKEVINHNQNYNQSTEDKQYDMSKLKPDEMVEFHKLLKKMDKDNNE